MVAKFTSQPKNKEVVTKINDVIDAMGTVKKVNNTSPDASGNVSLTIPTDTQDTCGATNSTEKLYLVGRTAQSTGTSNSNSSVYTQSGYLYAKTPSASSNTTSVATTKWVKDQGYTSNTGTVTSVNNVAPVSGNVTLNIPTYNFNGEPFYSTNGNATTITRDCNALTANGHYYYTSNGPSGLGEQSTDGAVYVQGYNDLWVTQIAQDYRTGNLFVRSRNSGTWTAWKAIGTSSGANTDLSNLSATGKAVLDGQWVYLNQSLISSATSINGTTNLEYTVNVPNDGYKYEIIVEAVMQTGASSGNVGRVTVWNSNVLEAMLCEVQTRSNATVETAGSCILPLETDRKLILRRNSGYNANVQQLKVVAYRRIGTNT